MKPDSRRAKLVFLAVVSAIAFFFAFQIIRPFLTAIVAAIILAILFHPLYKRLATRYSPTVSAVLCLMLFIFAVGGPAILLGLIAEREFLRGYRWLTANTAAQNGWPSAFGTWLDAATSWISGRLGIDPDVVRQTALSRLRETGNAVVAAGAGLVGNISSFVVSLSLSLLAFFALLMRGESLVESAGRMTPLSDSEFHSITKAFTDAVQANVLGVLAVGLTQGYLLGLGFWMFGVPSPALWGLVTVVCSAIPMFGAAIVWAPGALYLFLQHSMLKGFLLLGWGAGIVSLSDNIIRPWVLGERVRLSPVLLLFALLGGVEAFGILGLFLGPILMAVAIRFGAMLFNEWQGERSPVVLDSDATLNQGNS